MKIIYYSPHPHLSLNAPSGYATHMRETIHAMEALGHTVIQLVTGNKQLFSGNATTTPSGKGLKKIIRKIIPISFWNSLKDLSLIEHDRKSYNKLLELCEKEKPDLIYERGYYLMTSGVRVAKKLGISHVIEINAPFLEETKSFRGGSFFKSLAQKKECFTLNNTNKIVTVSTALKEYLKTKYRIRESSFHVSPNCVNPQAIIIDQQLKSDLISRYKISGPVIGFVGSIFPYHGVELLVEAFDRISFHFPTASLLIVGDGETLNEIRFRASKLKSSKSIIFTGNVPHNEVFSYIDTFDVAVMARSNWYGSPVKIFEYGALGKPIIGPATSPVKEVIDDGLDGLLVEPDLKSIADAISVMLNDPAKASLMGKKFREKVLSKYIWEYSINTVLQSVM